MNLLFSLEFSSLYYDPFPSSAISWLFICFVLLLIESHYCLENSVPPGIAFLSIVISLNFWAKFISPFEVSEIMSIRYRFNPQISLKWQKEKHILSSWFLFLQFRNCYYIYTYIICVYIHIYYTEWLILSSALENTYMKLLV